VKGTVKAVAALTMLGIVTACGSSSSSSSAPSPSSSGGGSSTTPAAGGGGKFLACMVTDTGGIDDRSFNQSSYAGLLAAAKADPNITTKYLQSASTTDYASNISAFLSQKCGIIVTVGFLMGAATQTAAKANASQKFAIVDFNYTPTLKNVDGLLFNTAQSGFLGGYLAAGMSKTGKVATFGGQKIGPVTIYMDGFWDGVQYYNKQHHKSVQVLGWSEPTQRGVFTNNFTNQTQGQTTTQTFITEGADVIFPVAGSVGIGAAKAVQTADNGGQHVNMMWVDTDGCVSLPQFCKYFITSVEKGITTAVMNAVLAAAKGSFTGGTYVGTLANGGAGLAPFHMFQGKVPAALMSELNTIKSQIQSGKIKIATKSPV
jgi:basic membrane protein A